MPRVRVSGVPAWVPVERLLSDHSWQSLDGDWVADLDRREAADLGARLRGLGMGGGQLIVEIVPPLKRALVRAARTVDARRRRDTTPGFTRLGVRLDDDGRRSLTPEALALALGEEAAGRVVIDATCGAGGNTIGFARAGCDVVAIEPDSRRLAEARHNAEQYGVAERIRFVQGRAEDHMASWSADLVFVDPPWGTDWSRERTELGDLPVLVSILPVLGPGLEVWAKVPPSFDPGSLPGWLPDAWFGRALGDTRRVKFVRMRRPVG